MPIETICQSCARKLRVPDEHAGKKARCPQCGTIYIVPGEPVATASVDSPSQREPNRAPHTKDERWQMRTADGRVYGPVPKAELDQWYAEGRVPAEAFLLLEGESQWRNAADIYPSLSGRTRSLNEQHNPFSDTVTARPATTPFHATSFRYQAPHRGGLILTLAICSWALCPILAPFAWAMGSSDLRAMSAGRMDPNGRSLTQAGMVLGIIATLLGGLVLIAVCLGGFG